MTQKVRENAAVAWLNADHPEAADGAGYYLVDSEDEDNHGNADFVRKVGWQKDKADKEGEPADSKNNAGHFFYESESKGGE